jgi:hypothetical protein
MMRHVLLGSIVVLTACSGQEAPNNCDHCESPDGAGPEDSTADVSDSTAPDGSSQDAVADTAHDGPADSPAPNEASVDGSSLDAQDAATAADPCPTSGPTGGVELDCDRTCCSADPVCVSQEDDAGTIPRCTAASCSGAPIALPTIAAEYYVVRTPNAPGADPACAQNCSSGSYAYGLGFQLNTNQPNGVSVTVGSPWVIVQSSTPYCPEADAAAQTGCVYIDVYKPVYVLTTDPNAPARNITFYASPTCPADAGAGD